MDRYVPVFFVSNLNFSLGVDAAFKSSTDPKVYNGIVFYFQDWTDKLAFRASL